MDKEEYKCVEVTYKFHLPENQEELKEFQNTSDYVAALWEIHDKCRCVLKYEEDPSEDKQILAEEISLIVNESGAIR